MFQGKGENWTGLNTVSERVRVSKGMEVTQNMLYERGGKLISQEQIIYVGEQ